MDRRKVPQQTELSANVEDPLWGPNTTARTYVNVIEKNLEYTTKVHLCGNLKTETGTTSNSFTKVSGLHYNQVNFGNK